jgi:hypothetical protein
MSRVTLLEECPSISETALGSAFLGDSGVAQVGPRGTMDS